MRAGMRSWVLATGVWLGLAGPAAATLPRFEGLGDLPGGLEESFARDVSADGTTVVGVSSSGGQVGGEAFRWTAAGGMEGIGSLAPFLGPFFEFSEARAISGDGSTIVGSSNVAFGREAFRWVDGEMEGLGFLEPGADFSAANDVSANGAVVVGFSRFFFRTAFRWTAGGGLQSLGFFDGFNNSRATGVSANGATVAGFVGELGGPDMEAFRWTTGSQTIALLDDDAVKSEASAISALGNAIVGTLGSGSDTEAFRWSFGTGQIEGLGGLLIPESEEEASSEALGVSPDGSTVVGTSDGRAIVWDEANGMRDLQAELEAVGLDLTGWSLIAATAVAFDNRTIVGDAINPEGDPEGFIATLGDPLAIPPQAVATGRDFSCAILGGGAVTCWGGSFPTSPFAESVVQISAGETHLCGIDGVGGIVCAGSDPGETGKTDPPPGAFTKVSSGAEFTCALAVGGGITCFGDLPGEQEPAGTDFVDVSAGREHVCAVTSQGAVTCFGADTDETGKKEPPAMLPAATQVAAGDFHTCALLDDGMAACWGAGEEGDAEEGVNAAQSIPLGGTFSALASGSLHTCGLRTPTPGQAFADVVACWGAGRNGAPDGQATPPAEVLFTSLDAGGMNTLTGHTCAIDTAGSVWCWGQNGDLQSCPPGDDDCDGVPNDADNCPAEGVENFNPDQLDSDADGIGDVCDLCNPGDLPEGVMGSVFDPDGDPLAQADMDEDGIGDLCDACPEIDTMGVNDPGLCDPLAVRIVETPVGLGEVLEGASNATTPTSFNIVLDCGGNTAIRKVALGIALPEDLGPMDVRFGNDCTATGCPVADPAGELSDEVEPMDPETFVLKQGEAGNPAANPDAIYFSLKAKNTSPGLCTQGQQDRFLALLTVGGLATGFTPPFTTQGATETVGTLAESDTGDVSETDIELQNGSANPQATIALQPDIVLNPNGTRYTSVGIFELDLSRVTYAVQGDGALEMLGCDIPATDPCVTALPRFNCSGSGTVPLEQLPPNVDFGSPNTFVLGPAAPGADLSGLPGVTPNTLYISLEGKMNVGFGTTRSLNPGALETSLGTVEFDPSSSQQGMVAPSLVFSGLDTLFAGDRTASCTVDPDFEPFQVTDTDFEDDFGVDQALGIQTFVFGQDPDGDNWASDFDDCPFTSDPGQADNGGTESPSNVDGADANGIGDVCECGDVTASDGRVRIADGDVVLDILTEQTPAGTNEQLCSTTADPGCGPEDWGALKRSQAEQAGGIRAACPPALP